MWPRISHSNSLNGISFPINWSNSIDSAQCLCFFLLCMSPTHSNRTLSHKFVTLSQTVLRYVTLTLNVTLEWASGERRKPDIIYTSLSQTKEELAFSIIKNLVGSECFILLFETEWRAILHHLQMHFSGSMDCELYYMFYCPRFHEMFTHYWPTVYVRIHPLVFTQKKRGENVYYAPSWIPQNRKANFCVSTSTRFPTKLSVETCLSGDWKQKDPCRYKYRV